MTDPFRRPLEAIAVAGLIAGVLDLGYVMALYAIKFPAVRAKRLLQGIAAGAIGPDAAGKGGMATAALGLPCISRSGGPWRRFSTR